MILVDKATVGDKADLDGFVGYIVPTEVFEAYEERLPEMERFCVKNLSEKGIESIFLIKRYRLKYQPGFEMFGKDLLKPKDDTE